MPPTSWTHRVTSALAPAVAGAARAALRAIAGAASLPRDREQSSHRRRTPRRPSPRPRAHRPQPSPTAPPHDEPRDTNAAHEYPGDWVGPLDPVYAPVDDDRADPGEIVWAWVPYEEDHSRGKDRPALVVGRDGSHLLALPLTSKDHDRDAAGEAAAGRHWIDIGSGAWDTRGRPSEARVDRVVRIDQDGIRRSGSRLDEVIFAQVAAAVRAARR